MAISQREKILTSLVGEYSVAGKLCLMGYFASLTLKNYPEVDIFVFNEKNDKSVAIQVKTIREANAKHDSYYVPEKIEEITTPFVFVHINKDNSIDYYVVPAKDVAEISHKEGQDYLKTHPAANPKQSRMLSVKNITQFKDKWGLLELE